MDSHTPNSPHQRFGWKKDKFIPNATYHVLDPAAKIPTIFSLEQYLMPVGDQGRVNSCTGWGISGGLSSKAKMLGVFKERFSITWIYNGERFMEGDLSEDAFAFPEDGFKWVCQKGCLLEEYWPYDPNKLDTTPPPSKDDPLAAQWPVDSYTRVVGGFPAICSAIAAGNFVPLGNPWFKSWMQPAPDGVLAEVNSHSPLAPGLGHETFLYGYDQKENVVFGQNSWTTKWGKGGRYVMPASAFDVFNQLIGYDACYATVKWGPATPTPAFLTPPMIRIEKSEDSGKTWQVLWQGKITK